MALEGLVHFLQNGWDERTNFNGCPARLIRSVREPAHRLWFPLRKAQKGSFPKPGLGYSFASYRSKKWISGDSRQLGSDPSVLYLRGFFEFTSKKARLGLDRGDCSMAFSRGLQPAS